MKLTKLEMKTLTIAHTNSILQKCKAKDFCVITIYNIDNSIINVDRFTTFRHDLKIAPRQYNDLKKFRYILMYLF